MTGDLPPAAVRSSSLARLVGPLRRTRRSSGPLLRQAVGNADAFIGFYDAYCDRVVGYFMRRTFDVEASLELTSETFAIALEKCGDFRGSTEQAEQGWLFAIARSQLARYWRDGQAERDAVDRLRIQVPAVHEDDQDYIARAAELDDLRPLLVSALASISEDQREAVRLRVIEELDYPEIAKQLQVNEEVARARVSRGLRALAETMDENQESAA